MSGYIYFAEKQGLIKIGFSKKPNERIPQLSGSKLLAVISGSRDDERALHSKFAELRVSGEWFKDDFSLREHIRLLPDTDIPGRSHSVRIRRATYNALKALAKERGVMISWLLNRILDQQLAEEERKQP